MGLFKKQFVPLSQFSGDRLPRNKKEAQFMAPQYLKIANDCKNLVNTTKTPRVFFERYDLLIDEFEKLSRIEHWVKFTGQKPSAALSQIYKQRTAATNDLIDRYAEDIRIQIKALSTEKAKTNRVKKFMDEMGKYEFCMESENIARYKSKKFIS